MNTKKLLAVTLVAVLFYAAIALWGDVQKLRELLSDFRWWTFGAALALAFTNYLLRFLKWQYYLARLDVKNVPVTESFAIFLSGFVMSITPAKAGEVFKSALLASARGVPVARSAPIVVADRLTDLVSLILIVAVGGLYFPGGWKYAAAAGVLVAGLMAFVLSRPLGEAVIRLGERHHVGRRLAPKLREAYDALQHLAGPSALVIPTLLSLVAWGCECMGLWLILRGLGHPVGVGVACFVYATSTVAGAVMMLPGGVGGTEGMMMVLLRDLALGAGGMTAARAGTLLVRLATLWFAVLVGAVALLVFRRRYDRGMATHDGSALPAAPVAPAA